MLGLLLEDLDGACFKVFVNSEFGEKFAELDVTQIRYRAIGNNICPPGSHKVEEADYAEFYFWTEGVCLFYRGLPCLLYYKEVTTTALKQNTQCQMCVLLGNIH